MKDHWARITRAEHRASVRRPPEDPIGWMTSGEQRAAMAALVATARERIATGQVAPATPDDLADLERTKAELAALVAGARFRCG